MVKRPLEMLLVAVPAVLTVLGCASSRSDARNDARPSWPAAASGGGGKAAPAAAARAAPGDGPRGVGKEVSPRGQSAPLEVDHARVPGGRRSDRAVRLPGGARGGTAPGPRRSGSPLSRGP